MINNKVKLGHSLEFASFLKALGRVMGALFIHKYLKNLFTHKYLKSIKKKSSTRLKSQFA